MAKRTNSEIPSAQKSKIINWLVSRYLNELSRPKHSITNEEEKFVIVTFNDFAQFLIDINANMHSVLDACVCEGWIYDSKIENSIAPMEECEPIDESIMKLNLPIGTTRTIMIRPKVLKQNVEGGNVGGRPRGDFNTKIGPWIRETYPHNRDLKSVFDEVKTKFGYLKSFPKFKEQWDNFNYQSNKSKS